MVAIKSMVKSITKVTKVTKITKVTTQLTTIRGVARGRRKVVLPPREIEARNGKMGETSLF